jgi:Spy/CpxP family protein refolding chaperone
MRIHTAKRPTILLMAIVIAALLTVGSVIAATSRIAGGKGKMGHERLFQKAAKELNLTTTQQNQIKSILSEQKVKLQNLRQSNLSPAEKKTQRQGIWKETKDRIAPILTPEQQKKAKQLWAQHRKSMSKRCVSKLNLTADQQAKFAAIRLDAKNAIRGVKTDNRLSDQAKRDKIMAVRKQARKDLMSLLTPEQRAKVKAFCNKRGMKVNMVRMGC